ncbi:HAD-IB family hydrolase [Hoyosella rhizosphaerae]|uniref:Morphological differentiation-associated protein n=1 Tax=Hoyosella rhizosphaerae TaxID=1755582 RepID=A0A916XIK4_9ACTN|nr:HAD-IB family hydrolase [Hoyosella rhizosphaerae]MBN4925355.1 HAD-IB family hydrolase [Hoyosella rhizosphaerae]GGC75906.1 morphological differentiation-associated protein [Hoyosella rhizosphaerae]
MNHALDDATDTERPAAFFDLDKAIIARTSTLAFSKPFSEAGLINRRAVLKSTYAQFLALMPGADHEQTERLRTHIASMCQGWDTEHVANIVGETLHDIVTPFVFAEAAALMEDHRSRGHDVVVVSASGVEVVSPIAEALGADATIASTMGTIDGKYSGEFQFYCHGRDKAEAIRDLANEKKYDLARSFAYSDSASDLPMLALVGHPTAVNPDRDLRREAAAKGWPILTFSDAISLREHLPAPSTRTLAATAALGISAAVAAGAVAFSFLRHRR